MAPAPHQIAWGAYLILFLGLRITLLVCTPKINFLDFDQERVQCNLVIRLRSDACEISNLHEVVSGDRFKCKAVFRRKRVNFLCCCGNVHGT